MIHARLRARLDALLAREGFEATLQQGSQQSGDFDVTSSEWSDIATVKALWDNPRRMWKGLNDGAPASSTERRMTIAHRDELKEPSSAVRLRVVVNGVISNVLSVAEIGEKVGLRLSLDTGTEA
jgi:hypothetical protein